jgi:hypothetical protein
MGIFKLMRLSDLRFLLYENIEAHEIVRSQVLYGNTEAHEIFSSEDLTMWEYSSSLYCEISGSYDVYCED